MTAAIVVAGLLSVLLLVLAVSAISSLLQGRDAESRADSLVRALLTSEEYTRLRQRGYLEVPSRIWPRRVYRIPAGDALVAMYDRDQPVALLCLRPVSPLPQREVPLAHKLFLEADEAGYLRHANILPFHYPASTGGLDRLVHTRCARDPRV